MWMPLLLGSRDREQTWNNLRVVLVWYLSLVVAVSHLHRMLPSAWDPSGHVFVYGAQLIPWFSRGGVHPWALCWCLTWAAVLTYLSFTTGSFFHTSSETVAGWLLVVLLRCCLRALPKAAPEAQATQDRHATWKWVLGSAMFLWLGATVAVWSDGGGGLILIGETIYDSAVWCVLLSSEVFAPWAAGSAGWRTHEDTAATRDGVALHEVRGQHVPLRPGNLRSRAPSESPPSA